MLLVPAQYIVPIVCPVAVTIILQVPADDTTSDRSASAVSVISQLPTPLTHITGLAVLFSTLSEEATIYQAVLGSIHQE
jgi:energy-converting hydrogenase Eha subunit A